MERAIDVVIDIHTRAEIIRLQEDIQKKCKQIADLLVRKDDEVIQWTNPRFYAKVQGQKKLRLDL